MTLYHTKEWGAASPQLFQAFATNEPLTTVLFEFVQTTADGLEIVSYTIKLSNAIVSDIKYYTERASTPTHDMHGLEEVSLTFGKIAIENKLAKTMAADELRV